VTRQVNVRSKDRVRLVKMPSGRQP
jgi:hypothetical protein